MAINRSEKFCKYVVGNRLYSNTENKNSRGGIWWILYSGDKTILEISVITGFHLCSYSEIKSYIEDPFWRIVEE